MRALLLLAAVVLCGPASATEQTTSQSQSNSLQGAPSEEATTAEAMSAIGRGEYTRAAELLKPLVEPWSLGSGHAAAFHLAQLYEIGVGGVPHDPLRACALFGRAATASAGWSAAMAWTAFERFHAQAELLGPNGVAVCGRAANLGPDHGFAPATFTLGTDHWGTIDLTPELETDVRANISYRGQEKSVPLSVPMGLATVFLPFQYSALEMVPGAPERHFVEAAAWVGGVQGMWGLSWSLAEIAEGDVIEVASAELDSFKGTMPPRVVNPREYVTLRVNELDTAGIPDRKEREEIASELARRDAARKAIDWKLRRDPARAPSFQIVEAEGCGNVQLFAWTSDRTEAVVAFVDRELFELSASPRNIDLSIPHDGVRVFIDVADRPQQSSYCSDLNVTEQGYRQETWQAVGGTLTIQVSPPGSRAQSPQQYRATIQIDNAVFRNASGRIVRPSAPIRLTGMAGLFAG